MLEKTKIMLKILTSESTSVMHKLKALEQKNYSTKVVFKVG